MFRKISDSDVRVYGKGGGAKFNQEVNGTAPCLHMFASSRGEYFQY